MKKAFFGNGRRVEGAPRRLTEFQLIRKPWGGPCERGPGGTPAVSAKAKKPGLSDGEKLVFEGMKSISWSGETAMKVIELRRALFKEEIVFPQGYEPGQTIELKETGEKRSISIAINRHTLSIDVGLPSDELDKVGVLCNTILEHFEDIRLMVSQEKEENRCLGISGNMLRPLTEYERALEAGTPTATQGC